MLPLYGGSRTGTTGFQFLKNIPDARGSAMAGAVLADVNDASALYWNPAGLTKLDSGNFHLMMSQTSFFAGINQQYVAAAINRKSDTYWGISYLGFFTPEMNVTTEFQPTGTGQTFRAYNMAVGIGMGKRMTENFSFGLNLKYVRESFAEVHSASVVSDFGFQYDVGKANTRFAAGVSNFGFSAEPHGTVISPGLDGTDTLNSFRKIEIPAIFRLGIACDAIKNNTNCLTFQGQLNHPADNNETISIGSEYDWRDILFVRTGYEFGQDTGGLPGFGFGFRFKRRFGIIQLDYGFSNRINAGVAHRMTIALNLF